MYVSANSGLQLDLCSGPTHNFICAFDVTKYTIVGGYQGDICGPSSRTGGAPQPGLTCYSDNPLANATANPYPYAVLAADLSGTLVQFADQ